jgi:alpha-tubulin suppressor-like RCC1 family protein
VKAIAAGFLHSAALLSNGTVVVWGDNSSGQANVPPALSNIVAIASGDFHILALRADGSVIGWGDDLFGQVDVPNSITNATAIASGYYHGLALLPTTPATLHVERIANGIVISWSGAGTLQSAPAVTGPFADILNGTQRYTNSDLSLPATFYRLRK